MLELKIYLRSDIDIVCMDITKNSCILTSADKPSIGIWLSESYEIIVIIKIDLTSHEQ